MLEMRALASLHDGPAFQEFLDSFDRNAASRGAAFFNSGAVHRLTCVTPCRRYTASVLVVLLAGTWLFLRRAGVRARSPTPTPMPVSAPRPMPWPRT